MRPFLCIFFLLFQIFCFSEVSLSLQEFVEKNLLYSLKDTHLSLHKSSNLAERGFDSQIYYLKNPNQEVLAVLKIFHQNEEGEKEKFCHEQLLNKSWKCIEPIKIKGFAKQDQSFILGLEYAQGKSISSMIEALSKKSPYKKERHRLFSELIKAVKQTALAFKELHQTKCCTQIAPHYTSHNEKIIEQFIKNYERYGFKISKEKFTKYIQHLYEAFYRENTQLGIIHGDAHPGNIFYNLSDTEKITLLDLTEMYPSLKDPLFGGVLIEDAIKFTYYTELIGLRYGLKKKEITQIQDAFYQSYGYPIPQKHLLFYRMLITMQLLNRFINNTFLSKLALKTLQSILIKDFESSLIIICGNTADI